MATASYRVLKFLVWPFSKDWPISKGRMNLFPFLNDWKPLYYSDNLKKNFKWTKKSNFMNAFYLISY